MDRSKWPDLKIKTKTNEDKEEPVESLTQEDNVTPAGKGSAGTRGLSNQKVSIGLGKEPLCDVDKDNIVSCGEELMDNI